MLGSMRAASSRRCLGSRSVSRQPLPTYRRFGGLLFLVERVDQSEPALRQGFLRHRLCLRAKPPPNHAERLRPRAAHVVFLRLVRPEKIGNEPIPTRCEFLAELADVGNEPE